MLQEFLELFNKPYIRNILLVVITAMVTRLIDVSKLKKSQSIRFQESLGEKVGNALDGTREVITNAATFAVLSECLEYTKVESADMSDQFVYYPEFMRNQDSYLDFVISISETRKNYELYLDICSAAYLYVEERYLITLSRYINKYGLQEKPYLIGTVVIVDILKWYREFDRHLVRMMNKPHYKIYATSGFRWEILKKYMKYKYLKKSVLNEMIQNKHEPHLEMLIPDKKEIDNEEAEA